MALSSANIFRWYFPFSGSDWWLSIFMETEFLENSKSLFLFIQCLPQKIQVSALRRNLGCAPYARNWVFFQIYEIQYFFLFITQLFKKKLQQWALYEVIEGILPFVLNTNRPLSDIWLRSYEQDSFGCFFWKKLHSEFVRKHPKLFCLYLSNQILLRGRFLFKTNGRISSITTHKDHWYSFIYKLSNEAIKNLYFENFEKTPNFGIWKNKHLRISWAYLKRVSYTQIFKTHLGIFHINTQNFSMPNDPKWGVKIGV